MKSSTSANLQKHNQRAIHTILPLQIKEIKSLKNKVVAGWTDFPLHAKKKTKKQKKNKIYCESVKSSRDVRSFDEVKNVCLLLHDFSEPFFIVRYARIKLVVCCLDCPSLLETCSRKQARK